jgi:hypothetical protein
MKIVKGRLPYDRLLKNRGWSFQVIEAPRGSHFGGGAGHRNSGIGTSRNYWNCAIFMGNPHNIFLYALWGLRHGMPPLPPLWHPPGFDNSREGTTPPSHSAGAVRGDGHRLIRKTGDLAFVEIFGLYRDEIYAFKFESSLRQ